LDHELKGLGFRRSNVEHVVYRRSEGDSFLLIVVYVDDLIICGPDDRIIERFKQQMKKLFSMSEHGLLSYYLGMEVKQKPREITLCQSVYASKIVELCGMKGCDVVDTPMEQHVKPLAGTAGNEVDVTRYRSIIGSLKYLVNTRPDIAYSVGVASRFMEAPTKEHWTVVKRNVRYISGTINYGCKYVKGGNLELELLGFTDSDLAGDLVQRKSTTGIVFFLGPNLVTWTSQKQRVVSLSSCEAKYIAAAVGACQGVWLSRLVAELTGRKVQKFKLLIDNKSAIELSKNPVYHARSKHIDTWFHFIHECVSDGVVDVDHISIDGQLVDILTKALGRVRFVKMRQKLGVIKVQQD
jgi:hypothetical protein